MWHVSQQNEKCSCYCSVVSQFNNNIPVSKTFSAQGQEVEFHEIEIILNFDLMIILATNKLIMRSKLLIMLFWVSISWSKIRPPDQYYWTNSISWTNWISISWSKIQPPEKVEFRSHEIRPHDHSPLFLPKE
jgi:hypothetical protein